MANFFFRFLKIYLRLIFYAIMICILGFLFLSSDSYTVKFMVVIVLVVLLVSDFAVVITAAQTRYQREYNRRKEVHLAEREQLRIANGLLQFYKQKADAVRERRDSIRKEIQELTTNPPHPSFICPLTNEVMRDPQAIADGTSYDGEAIRNWFASGHTTSPLTNLNLPHFNLLPNHALRSAIED